MATRPRLLSRALARASHLRARPRSRAAKVALAAVAVMAIALPSAAIGAVAVTPTYESQDRIIVRGGVIRLGRTVYLHDNSSHAAIGIKSIALVNSCDLRVNFDAAVKPEEIVAAVAEEDETMARLGVKAGVSGGNGYANVLLYRNGAKVCANNAMFGTSSNIWLHMTYLQRP